MTRLSVAPAPITFDDAHDLELAVAFILDVARMARDIGSGHDDGPCGRAAVVLRDIAASLATAPVVRAPVDDVDLRRERDAALAEVERLREACLTQVGTLLMDEAASREHVDRLLALGLPEPALVAEVARLRHENDELRQRLADAGVSP